MPSAALADPELQKRAEIRRGEFHRAPPRRSPTSCRSSRRCATPRATSRTTRSPISTSISRPIEERVDGGGRPRALGRDGRGRAAASCSTSAASVGAKHRHQGQVDDRRGDRPQRLPRAPTASRRSRPISANTSSSCATRLPSHIIAPAVHLTKDAGRGGLPPRAHASAGRPRPRRADHAARRGARRAARALPRRRCRHHRRELPGRRDRHRRSSSPTRAMAT